ncbi:MAG: helix-turn-helix domain-containing protein [Gaiellaceae bacterium]
MTSRTLTPPRALPPTATAGLGSRIRELRVEHGLTQTELAGARFTKEYLSQIERGRTRPTSETVAWIADQLDVEAGFLVTGQIWSDYESVAIVLVEAEHAVEAQEYERAVELLSALPHSVHAPELELRSCWALSWALMYLGELDRAVALLDRARALAELEAFSDVERAEVLYRLGVCRYKLSSVDTALASFTEALALAEGSGYPCDRLRAHVFEWRSRCWRRQRDLEAAREDIERALELARELEDELTVAHVTFQASIVAERSGNWRRARALAEQARVIYESHDDHINVGRLRNNLGGLEFLLERPEQAVEHLKNAFAIALEHGSDGDAGQAESSLAQIHLRSGAVELAERQARHALELLAGREDFLDEIGNAQIVVGRALIAQGRLDEAAEVLAQAEDSLSRLSSASHRALAWQARAELAAARGDDRGTAVLYRRAAEALQDVEF